MSAEQAAEASSLVPPLFLWSAALHVAVVLALLQMQRLVAGMGSPRSSALLSEFLFSVAWVVTSLENTVLSVMWSKTSGLVALGLRIFFSSVVFHEVHGNPCTAVFFHYSSRRWPPAKKLSSLLRTLCAQALAVPLGVAIAMLSWRLLALTSSAHADFVQKEIRFPSASPLTGVTIEAGVAFLMFLPGLLLFPSLPSTVFKLIDTVFILFFIHHFDAIVNPIAAMACYLTWNRDVHSSSILEFAVVYFLGPMVGTWVAVTVAKQSKRKQS